MCPVAMEKGFGVGEGRAPCTAGLHMLLSKISREEGGSFFCPKKYPKTVLFLLRNRTHNGMLWGKHLSSRAAFGYRERLWTGDTGVDTNSRTGQVPVLFLVGTAFVPSTLVCRLSHHCPLSRAGRTPPLALLVLWPQLLYIFWVTQQDHAATTAKTPTPFPDQPARSPRPHQSAALAAAGLRGRVTAPSSLKRG